MRNLENRTWLVLVMAVAALSVGGCGKDETTSTEAGAQPVKTYPSSTTMGKIQDAGEIRVGVKYDVPGFGLEQPQTGEVDGFDVDMAQLVADRLGVKLKTVKTNSENRIPLLQDGTVDLVFSTMTIT